MHDLERLAALVGERVRVAPAPRPPRASRAAPRPRGARPRAAAALTKMRARSRPRRTPWPGRLAVDLAELVDLHDVRVVRAARTVAPRPRASRMNSGSRDEVREDALDHDGRAKPLRPVGDGAIDHAHAADAQPLDEAKAAEVRTRSSYPKGAIAMLSADEWPSRTRRMPDDGRPRSIRRARRCGWSWSSGPDRGKALRVAKEEVIVGTGPSADLRLTDPTVSRNHLALRLTSDGILVTDLDSTNGTRIDKRRIRAASSSAATTSTSARPACASSSMRERRRAAAVDGASRFGRAARAQPGPMRRAFALLRAVGRRRRDGAHPGRDRHRQGRRGRGASTRPGRAPRPPFVVVDCGAIAGELDRERAVRPRARRLHRRA